MKVILWIFLFIPIIIGFGASGTGLIVGSIVGIGFLSAFSFTVSTYTIFTASLILLCILFGGLTMVFGLIWFIKYLLGISDIKKECSNNGFQNNMNYNNNFAYSGSNPQAYANGNCPNEPFANINNTPQTTDEVPVEDAPIDTDYLSQNPTIDETSEEDR